MEKATSVVVLVQDLFFAVRLSDVLHTLGYRGLTVQSEKELQDTLSKERPRLIILDLQALGIRPEAVVSAARAAAAGRPIPVLAFGPHTDAKRRTDAMAAGCQRVVPKSMIVTELPQLVKSMLRL